MGDPLPPCEASPTVSWRRIYGFATALTFATVVALVLSPSSEWFEDSGLRGREHHLGDDVPGQGTSVFGSTTASGRTSASDNMRGLRELDLKGGWGNSASDTPRRLEQGEGLVKHYTTFVDYAVEVSKSTVSLPVPVVKGLGRTHDLSIPIITIIGAQKGGTTNLRENLLTHPMVAGKFHEVHYFDQAPDHFPPISEWEGEGLDKDIGAEAAGRILYEYAKICAPTGREYLASVTPGVDKVIVDSSPEYIVSPIAPYRIKMVRPSAKFVLVIRDPTDRYFSQLRMDMCRDNHDPTFLDMPDKLRRLFHHPGEAKEYLAKAEAGYEPYTALCRGENASEADLWKCYKALKVSIPLYRGLYADQLERWYRVFDRSQIMIVDANDMLADFGAVINEVTEFAGLPEHSYIYDPSREHKTGCDGRDRRVGNNYFVPGGSYEKMFEEEGLLREWYRPHNERLYELLGHDFMWK